jgi:hypothetical protein
MSLSNAFTTTNVSRRAKQVMFAMSAAGVLSVATAQTAAAAPSYNPSNTFTNIQACQQAGGQAVFAGGGPSRLQYRCEVVNNIQAGVMDCPVNSQTQQYGCSVEYYYLHTWPTGGLQ